jgi:hypothetical protein
MWEEKKAKIKPPLLLGLRFNAELFSNTGMRLQFIAFSSRKYL